ncbi:MAG: hypothetical protein ACLQBD_10490 [Syntrophobacteraceae bacterium]
MPEERSYSKEEIKAILQGKELMKERELQRQGAIRLVLISTTGLGEIRGLYRKVTSNGASD